MNQLEPISLLGNSSIGIFASATNSYALFPIGMKKNTLTRVKQTLQIPIIQTNLVGSRLIGLFAVGNTHHLLIPNLITDDEYNHLKSYLPNEVSIHIIDSKITALGNSIVCSDAVALVHPEFSSSEKKLISDFLDTEVESRKILENPLVGSLIYRNNRGLLAHPMINEEELEWLSAFFRIRSDVVTVNRGTPYPRPGLVGNEHGVLVGSDTSGPEMMRIYEILVSP